MAGARVIYLPVPKRPSAQEIVTGTTVAVSMAPGMSSSSRDCRLCQHGEPWRGDIVCEVAQDVVTDPREARECPSWLS